MRRSIAGPIFIILVGALLLAHNLLTDFSIWRAFAQHWPWLLVAWGGFRLLEHGLAAARDEPGPPPMRGGALVLAVLLCAVGSAAHAVQKAKWTDGIELLWSGFKLLDQTRDVEISESWPAADVRTLEIDGYLGEVTLSGDDGDSIRLDGKRRIVGDTPEAARTTSETAPPTFALDGDTARLSPSGSSKRRFSGDVVIHAPRSVALVIRQGDGELKVRDFDAGATIEAAGRVDIERVAGPVAVELRRGRRVEARSIAGDFKLNGSAREVELEEIGGGVSLAGDLFGKLEIESVGALQINSRRLTVKAPGRLHGRLEAGNGSVEVEGVEGGLDLEGTGRWEMQASDFGGPSRLIGQRGSIEAALDGRLWADLEMRLESGDLRLAIPAEADYILEADAKVIESSLPERRASADAPSAVGGGAGEPRLRLKTGRGRIELEPLDSSH